MSDFMKNTTSSFNSRQLEFAIFCIENIALKLDLDASKVYTMLTEDSDILYNYILPEYEILHTQSKEYIINELIDIMKEKGAFI